MEELEERLRRSNARFASSMQRIIEKYNYPFEDDLLVSMKSLTYDTPNGPQLWGEVSIKKKWKKKLHKTATQYQKITETQKEWISDFEDEDLKVHQEPARSSFIDSYEELQIADTDAESETGLVSIRRKFENVNLKEDTLLVNPSELEVSEKVRVRVDVIVQDAERNIPKWITVTPKEKSKSLHVKCQRQELIGMTKSPTAGKITAPRHTPFLEKNETGYDSFIEEYQSADEQCSWSNVTLADLYPGMVEALSKLINKQFQRNAADSIVRYYRGWRFRRSKLNVTTERIRRFRSSILKPVLLNTNCNGHKLPTGNNLNESNTLHNGKCEAQCVTNDESGVVSYTNVNTGEMGIDWSGNLEGNAYAQRTDQNISESVSPNATAGTEETFLIENPSEIVKSLHYSEDSQNGKLPEMPSLGYFSVTCSASPYLVKEGKDVKIGNTTFNNTSGFHFSTCNWNGDATTFPPLNNSSLLRKSNALIRNPEIKTFKGCFPLQRSHSFSSLPMNQSPVKTRQKCEDEFEKLYQKLCPKELQKPLEFRKPPSNPKQNEKLIKSYFCNSVKSHKKNDSAFDKIYQRLCSEGLPKLPAFLRASNLKKYEGIQMSETVNALINSPIQTLPAVTRIKRVADFYNEGLSSSPVKRLKNITEHFFSRDSGFHASANQTFLVSPGTFVQESKLANVYAHIPGTLQRTISSSRSAQKYQQRVSRKLGYSDGRERSSGVLED